MVDEPLGLLAHRHNSLSALDVKRFKIRTSSLALDNHDPDNTHTTDTRPKLSLPAVIQTSSISLASPLPSPQTASPISVQFSLGGEVTPINLLNINTPPRITNLITSERIPLRTRCHSWESSGGSGSMDKLITTTARDISGKQQSTNSDVNNFPTPLKLKERSCSCSSQTDINSFDCLDTTSDRYI